MKNQECAEYRAPEAARGEPCRGVPFFDDVA